jgi:N-acetylglutamate synthase-like GNAT family acetyltransferase
MMRNRPKPVVRPAEQAEIPALAALIATALELFRGIVPDKPLSLYIPHSCDVAGRWSDCDVLVAESADRRLAGTVSYVGPACRGDDGLPGGWATLRSLMVHPQMRGEGHGRRLVEHCIAAARSDGAPAVGLHTGAFMTAAQHLYRATGFHRSPAHDLCASTAMGFDPAAGDVVLLAYRLDL